MREGAFRSARRGWRFARCGAPWLLALGLVACATTGDSSLLPAVPAEIPDTGADGHVALRARFVYVVIPDLGPPATDGDSFERMLDLPAHYDRRHLYAAILARHPDARIYHTEVMEVRSATAQWSGNLMQSTESGPVVTAIPLTAKISRWSHYPGSKAVTAQFSVSGFTLPATDRPERRGEGELPPRHD